MHDSGLRGLETIMSRKENVTGEVFDVRQTHGILWRPENRIEQSSDQLGWSSIYVSQQYEQPFDDTYQPVKDHLVILHLDGPVRVERRLRGRLDHMLIPPGGIFAMPGGMDFWVRLLEPLHSIHFYVRDEVLREVAAEFWSGDPAKIQLLPLFGEVDPVVDGIARAANHAVTAGGGASQLLADYLARALSARLIARSVGTMVGPAERHMLEPMQRQRLHDFVAEHLAHPIGLADLADAAGLSPSRLARGFKRDTGMTPYHYVLLARVQLAKKLLRTTTQPIAEIALACGFSHQEHLTRMFKREVGTTPAAYRRTTRN